MKGKQNNSGGNGCSQKLFFEKIEEVDSASGQNGQEKKEWLVPGMSQATSLLVLKE